MMQTHLDYTDATIHIREEANGWITILLDDGQPEPIQLSMERFTAELLTDRLIEKLSPAHSELVN